MIDFEMICTAADQALVLALADLATIVSVVHQAHQARLGMGLAEIASAMVRRGKGHMAIRTHIRMRRSKVVPVEALAGLGEGDQAQWEALADQEGRRTTILILIMVLQAIGRRSGDQVDRLCRRKLLTVLLLVCHLVQGLEARLFRQGAAQRPVQALARPASKRSALLKPALAPHHLLVLQLALGLRQVLLQLVRRSVTSRLQAHLLQVPRHRHWLQLALAFLRRCRMLSGQRRLQQRALRVDLLPLLPTRRLRQAKRSLSALPLPFLQLLRLQLLVLLRQRLLVLALALVLVLLLL